MTSEIPSGDFAVYVFLEIVAFCFALAGVDAFVAGKSWRNYVGLLATAFCFFLAGIRWPWLRAKLAPKLAWIGRIRNQERELRTLREKIKELESPSQGSVSAPEPGNGNAAAYHEARAGEFKEQVTSLTRERDHLHSEVARLNQHIKELLGTLVQTRETSKIPQTKSPQGKLTIHSAVYGLETVEDINVTDKLRASIGDALAIRVDNDLVPRDPAKFQNKRLEVEYSYGSALKKKVSRPEYELLVLPEDSWLEKEIIRLRGAAKNMWNGPLFTIQNVSADPPTTDPKITYKNKIRILLTNSSGRNIHVWTPQWESTEVLCQDSPPGSRFRLMGSDGSWVKDETGNKEYESLPLQAGATADCYIGLLPPNGKSIAERIRTNTTVGTAIFPVKIEGKLYEIPITL